MRLCRPAIFAPPFFALSMFAGTPPAGAQVPSVFVIAASEGYGIGDCLAQGGSCGRLVADAWCVAHGAAHAISFGPAETYMAETHLPAPQASPGSLVISCGE